MRDEQKIEINAIPLWQSFLFFLFPTIGIIIAWKIGIPFFKSLGSAQNVSYMISMTFVLFPLLIASIIALKFESNKLSIRMLARRFRLKPVTGKDWLWILIGFTGILIFSGIFQLGIEFICNLLGVKYSTIPPELGFRIITKNEWWIFLIHGFYFLSNILGEEFLYRGYILPRQEIRYGKISWLINGSLWSMTHIGVGLSLVTMIPLLMIVPYIVQRQKNTWIGIIVHGLIAGMGFYLAAFGIVK